MSRSNPAGKTSGFTLVEMLIVGPVALLVISGFIAMMVTMVGDVMVSYGRNGLTHDIQGSLDTIEQDVRLSTQFLTTTGTMPTPQGKDGSVSAFTSTGGDLILGEIATDKSPLDPTRKFIYYDTPNGCADPAQQYKNRILFTTVMYTLRNGSLWRRTFVPAPGGTLCDQPWQVNTCAPGYAATDTQCKTNDTEVMKNVSTFTVTYYADGSSTTPIGAASASTASTVAVQINGQQTVAGRTLTATASVRATKLSDKDIALAPPAVPTVTAQPYNAAEPGTGTFTWTANPLVTFSVRYNINGGAWITAAESTQDSSIKLKASRADTITVQVAARNTTGSSGYGAGASRTIPSWDACSLQNSWANYGSPYARCGYTKTKDGIIILKGLIRIPSSTAPATSGQTLFTLPPGYRPSYRLIFHASSYDTTNTYGVKARVDVFPDGEVRIIDGNNNWVSLSDITFIPAGSLYSWSDVSYQNSWINYGGSFAPFQYTKDSTGRVHLQGLVKPDAGTASTTVTQLPAGYEPQQFLHLPDYRYDVKSIDENGTVIVPNYTGAYFAMQDMYYPVSFADWSNLTLQNSWVSYGSVNATPQYTRSSDCIVTVKGLIKSGTTGIAVVAATLPAGYRPSETLFFGGVTSTGYYRVQVEATGDIKLVYANATWSSLSMLNFVAGDGSPCPV